LLIIRCHIFALKASSTAYYSIITPLPGLTYLAVSLQAGRCPALISQAPDGAKQVTDLIYIKPEQRPGNTSLLLTFNFRLLTKKRRMHCIPSFFSIWGN